MRMITFSQIKDEWKKGRIVVAIVMVFDEVFERAIVQNTATKFRVKTSYGIALPRDLYSFDTFAEAQQYVNGQAEN